MNTYRHTFYAKCPNNQRTIAYRLTIVSENTIMVEEIVAAGQAANDLPMPYHENIADEFHRRFGGEQTIKAWHHGVEIETVRG